MGYTTKDELDFIKGIGTGIFDTEGKRCNTKRLVFLKGYEVALQKRENWKGLDKGIIIDALRSEIKQELAGGEKWIL